MIQSFLRYYSHYLFTGQAGGSFLLIILGFVGHDKIAAMTLITVAVSLSAFLFSGFNINHLDLSPNFAGVLMGIGNGLENISTILAPLSVGWIVTDSVSDFYYNKFTKFE